MRELCPRAPIRDINARLLNFQGELMNMQLILVAGSKKKTHALRASLTARSSWPSYAAVTELMYLRA